jgi:hypothetical protein
MDAIIAKNKLFHRKIYPTNDDVTTKTLAPVYTFATFPIIIRREARAGDAEKPSENFTYPTLEIIRASRGMCLGLEIYFSQD